MWNAKEMGTDDLSDFDQGQIKHEKTGSHKVCGSLTVSWGEYLLRRVGGGKKHECPNAEKIDDDHRSNVSRHWASTLSAYDVDQTFRSNTSHRYWARTHPPPR